MTERGDDLRTTAEDLAADATRLKKIEETKVKLDAGDPDLVDLSEEAVELTKGMAAKAKVQLELAEADA